jgi:hypothetical protein
LLASSFVAGDDGRTKRRKKKKRQRERNTKNLSQRALKKKEGEVVVDGY